MDLELIINIIREHKTYQNQLISHIFEYMTLINCPEFSTQTHKSEQQIRKLLHNTDSNHQLVNLIQIIDDQELYYIKDNDLTKTVIPVYRLNHQLADLELIGIIKDNSICWANGEKKSILPV